MKFLLYLIIGVLIGNCKEGQSEMTVTIFKHGKTINYTLSSQDEKKINELVKEIFMGIDENLKLYFDADRLKDMVNSEEVLEIIYTKPIKISTKEFGSFNLKKIIFPLTGDFIGNSNSLEITIIPGEEEYDTTPLRNTSGYNLLMSLKELIESSKVK